MSWNGAGVFNRIYSWVADKNAAIDITASRMDTDTNDITSNGFGNTLTRDGQGAASANLPMNNFRHTGVGNGVARTDYAALGQFEDGLINWGVDSGAADALAVSYSPAITALVDGQLCFVRAAHANATATPTFTPNGLTAHIITRQGGSALLVGDIPNANAELVLRYNLANTRWELLNPAAISVATANIQNSAVTYAKIQNVTNNRLLGNFSGGAAAPSEYALSGTNVSGSTITVPTPIQSAFKNLSVKVATNTTVALAADFITVFDGSSYLTLAFASTINLGTTGANALDTGTIAIDTWYYIWAIAKADGTTAGLASTSSTAPTMPTGYTFKARVGAVQTIHAGATLYGTWQLGRRAQYVIGLAQTTGPLMQMKAGTFGTFDTVNPTLSALTVMGNGKWVPSTASEIFVLCTSTKGGTAGNVLVAPNTSWSGSGNGPNGSNVIWPVYLQTGLGLNVAPPPMLLEGTDIGVALSNAGAAISCLGWIDNI